MSKWLGRMCHRRLQKSEKVKVNCLEDISRKREIESNSSGSTVTFAWGMRNMSATRQSRVTAGRGPSDISVLTFGRF
jgi:hypothetical protein